MSGSEGAYGALATGPRAEELRGRHKDYYVTLAREAWVELRGPDQASWRRLLDQEFDNLVQAFEWAVSSSDQEAALELVQAITSALYVRGAHMEDDRPWLERALSVGEPVPTAVRARVLRRLAVIVYSRDASEAHGLARESLQVARDAKSPREEAMALTGLGFRYSEEEGGAEAGIALLEEALRIAEESGDELTYADVVHRLSWKKWGKDPAGYITGYQKALEIYRRHGDKEDAAWILYGLSWGETDLTKARKYAEEALAIGRELENDTLVVCAIDVLGWLATMGGDYDAAGSRFAEGLADVRRPGRRWPLDWAVTWMLADSAQIDMDRGNLEAARERLEEAYQINEKRGGKFEMQWSKSSLGQVLYVLGDQDRGRRLMEEGISIAREMGRRDRLEWALADLGLALASADRVDEATVLYEEALTLLDKDTWPERHIGRLLALADARLRQDRPDEAAELLAEAREIAFTDPPPAPLHWRPRVEKAMSAVERARGNLDQAQHRSAAAIEGSRNLGHKPLLADSLEELAAILAVKGNAEAAARLCGASATLRESIGVPVHWSERLRHEREVAAVREALGDGAFDRLTSEGRSMNLEQAIKDAVTE